MLSKLLDLITGNDKDMEKRLFTTIVFIAILVGIAGTWVNFHLKMHWLLYFIVGLGCVMLIWIYILARFYSNYQVRAYIIIASVIISGAWLYNQGPLGSINYIFLLGFISFLSITKRKYHLIITVIGLTNLFLLYGVYHFFPDWVYPYPTQEVMINDLVSTFIYILIFIALLISYLRFNFEIEQQKVIDKNYVINEQHKAVQDGINYAEYIQRAIIQNEKAISPYFNKFYIFWKPKYRIGGDFYLVVEHPTNNDLLYVIVADCTGHGVPGALLTALGISIINETIFHNPDLRSGEILNLIREKFTSQLNQGEKMRFNTDGMDVALCLINKKTHELDYAGSNRPLYIIRNGEFIEYKPDRLPIGSHQYDVRAFKSAIIKLQTNDNIIMSTDGFADQYGELQQHKFYVAKFKQLLVDLSSQPFDLQKQLLIKSYENWKKNEEQTDDILVLNFIPILD